jgi:hypothetical protein
VVSTWGKLGLYGQAVSGQWSVYSKFGYYGQGQRSEVRETDRTTLLNLIYQYVARVSPDAAAPSAMHTLVLEYDSDSKYTRRTAVPCTHSMQL